MCCGNEIIIKVCKSEKERLSVSKREKEKKREKERRRAAAAALFNMSLLFVSKISFILQSFVETKTVRKSENQIVWKKRLVEKAFHYHQVENDYTLRIVANFITLKIVKGEL